MNLLHVYLQSTPRAENYPLLFTLPTVFPNRSEVAYNRLSQADRAELSWLRKADYDMLCEALDGYLGYIGVGLEQMTKRQYTVFRWMHRFWCKAARKFTQTLVTWGSAAFDKTPEGKKCYRREGGNINESVYLRTGTVTLKGILERAGQVYAQVMGYDESDPDRARAEADRVVVEYLRKKRGYLKAFDGRLKTTLQTLVDTFRPYIYYEMSGDIHEDCLGANPAGKWEYEHYIELCDSSDENDYHSQSEDDYEE